MIIKETNFNIIIFEKTFCFQVDCCDSHFSFLQKNSTFNEINK